MATPYLDEAERCSRVALLHEGRLLALDTPGALRAALPGEVMEVIAARPRPRDADARAAARRARRPAVRRARARAARAWLDRGRSARLEAALRQRRRRRRERAARAGVARGRVHRARHGTARRERYDADRGIVVVAAVLRCRVSAARSRRHFGSRWTMRSRAAWTTSHRLAELGAREDAARAVEDQRAGGASCRSSRCSPATRAPITWTRSAPFLAAAARDLSRRPRQLRSRRRSAVADLHRRPHARAERAAPRGGTARIAQDREAARADLKLEITRAYWAVITARASVDGVEQALTRIGAHLEDVRNQLAVGLVPPSDVFSAQAQQARQQMLLIEAAEHRRDHRRGLSTADRPDTGRAIRARRSPRHPAAAAVAGGCGAR